MDRPDRDQFLERISFGVIPIGATNTFAKRWFFNPGSFSSKELELRLLADSAMSVIRGISTKADLIHVSLEHSPTTTDHIQPSEKKSFLIKNNELYALSEFTAGFVTETDAYSDRYWYLPLIKSKINRYFMDRSLRRQPIKYEFDYKLKCNGCSKCLNQNELKIQLDQIINANKIKKQTSNSENKSLLQIIYSKFFTMSSIQAIESPAAKETRLNKIKTVETLIEKSKTKNEKCDKLTKSNLIQTQVYARVNDAGDTGSEPSAIECVLVKDENYNVKSMFLADKKLVKEFQIVKLNKNERSIYFKRAEENLENFFCVQIDGEIYKLDNFNENNLKIQVKHVEKCFRLLKHDPNYSLNIKPNDTMNVYSLIGKNSIVDNAREDDMPKIKPFEKYYLKFWNANQNENTTQSS